MDRSVTPAKGRGKSLAPHDWSTGLIITVLVILLVAIGVYWLNFGSGLSKSHSRWGQFGDYLGGVLNPAFALIALYLLFTTVRLQSQELRNSVCVLREQSRSLQLQNFESTFFQLVRLHHEIVRDIDLRGPQGDATTGRDCFRVFYEKRFTSIHEKTSASTPVERVVRAYGSFDRDHRHEVGHYFRNFYRTLKFVDGTKWMDTEKKRSYTGILRAQLSTYELVLMFYGTLHPVGEKMVDLVEEYSMFDNLEIRRLHDPDNEVRLYKRSAYGQQDVDRYFQGSSGNRTGSPTGEY